MLSSIWIRAFNKVVERSKNSALKWALPEPWIQTELYSALLEDSKKNGWHPLPIEVPYFTDCPTNKPKSNMDTIKWADLCLVNKGAWYWLELKARHVGADLRSRGAHNSAVDALRKDVVGLMGFDYKKTAAIWQNPNKQTKIYWINEHLEHRSNDLLNNACNFIVALIQLGTTQVVNEDDLNLKIKSWAKNRGLKVLPNYQVINHELPIGVLTLVMWSSIKR